MESMPETLKHAHEYRDPKIAQALVERIRRISRRPIRLMEVCGTHTMAIFRHGIRVLLPGTIRLLSGPGCPVCVTSQQDIDIFVAYAQRPGTIVATFGDLLRVPGSTSSLQAEKAQGRDVRVVYSTMDALTIARQNPARPVVFLGVGFETTAPTVAASILTARQTGLANFHVVSAHKTVPPALAALMAAETVAIDGFLLPGHVSVILGTAAYRPFFEAHRIPCAIAGFEPADILDAVHRLVAQIESGHPELVNAYPRAVSEEGNPRAREVMAQVFAAADAEWRGIGPIPGSGLAIRPAFAAHDARQALPVEVPPAREPAGCACGEILLGAKSPPECPLFRRACTPLHPVGPCMVSSEGTCAAYYRYHG
jgi:hydrogenase expression/formation protein HypD